MNTRAYMLAAGLALATLPFAATAQTVWDVSLPWGPNEFHTLNAQAFAEAVEEATDGEVRMVIHPAGALGVRANESLRAVEDGAVPMAEYALFQNVGELPLLGIEAIPFLINDYDDLRRMNALVRPVWEEQLARRNQIALYIVPWPSQNFFTKEPVEVIEDFYGVRMRVYDANTSTMVSRLGMTPQQMNNPDIVPALATGRLDAVMTSGTTAVAQNYWEFLNHTYTTNHLWASNVMAVNMEAWEELSADHRQVIRDLAREMEPGFWDISAAEHETRMAQLIENGMTVSAPSADLIGQMKAATADMADEFGAAVPDAAPVIAAFRSGN